MAAKKQTIVLIGGTRDGESVQVYQWQPLIYVTKRISFDEAQGLIIDEVKTWKSPEEVYIRNRDGDFVYDRTVNYKPE